MNDPLSSELLDELRPNLEAERKLKELLVAKARAYAYQKIGPDLERRVSASEIACSAAESLLSDVKHGRVEPEDSRQLYGLLLVRTKAKAIEGIRRAKAKKRDIGREGGDAEVAEDAETSPASQAAINETAREFANLICQEPDELRRCINQLGILGGFSANAIREALLKQDWIDKGSIPSASTIRLWIKAERVRIVRALHADGEE